MGCGNSSLNSKNNSENENNNAKRFFTESSLTDDEFLLIQNLIKEINDQSPTIIFYKAKINIQSEKTFVKEILLLDKAKLKSNSNSGQNIKYNFISNINTNSPLDISSIKINGKGIKSFERKKEEDKNISLSLFFELKILKMTLIAKLFQ